MKMILEGLVPGVQHGNDSKGSLKTPLAKLKQRFTNGFKEKTEQIFLLARIRRFNSWGKVNTRWKYPTGKSSEVCFFNHWALANDWHLGQWRLRQEL